MSSNNRNNGKHGPGDGETQLTHVPQPKQPFNDLILKILAVFTVPVMFISVSALINETGALATFKVLLITGSACLAAYAVNVIAVRHLAPLWAINFRAAGIAAIAGILLTGSALFMASLFGITHPQMSYRTFDDHGTVLSQYTVETNDLALQVAHVAPGARLAAEDIRRDVLEGDFAEVVRSLQPSEGLYALVKAMFKDVWTQRMAQAETMLHGLKREAVQVDKKIENLLDRIVDTENPRVITAYEKRLSKLETDKLVLAEKQQNGVKPAHSFDDLFELATNFLANPWKLWESGQLTLKRTVLRLAFSERIAYCRNEGLRTPKTTLPFKVLEGLHRGKCEMAEPK